jgi:glucose-1-phosphate thymidylyltransferase
VAPEPPPALSTFDGASFDIGTPESYLDAVAWHLDGDTHVAADATVENTDLHENTHIMRGATVTNSTLDRTVVFPEATIEDSALRASIIDEQAILEDLDLAGALVGAHSQIP